VISRSFDQFTYQELSSRHLGGGVGGPNSPDRGAGVEGSGAAGVATIGAGDNSGLAVDIDAN
jgi:hypothetical protein